MIENDKYLSALDLAESKPEDSEKVYKLLCEAAKLGDDRAIFAAADWLCQGTPPSIRADPHSAFEQMKSLEKSNIAEALFFLGAVYDQGHLVERDELTAFSFYMKAALLGNSESCHQIAEFYREGKIVAEDKRISEAWRKRSKCDERDISPPYRVWLRP